MDAGIALLNKSGLHPSVYFEFALLALDPLEDFDLAQRILVAASSIANDDDWDRQMLEALDARGHADFSDTLAERLELQVQQGQMH